MRPPALKTGPFRVGPPAFDLYHHQHGCQHDSRSLRQQLSCLASLSTAARPLLVCLRETRGAVLVISRSIGSIFLGKLGVAALLISSRELNPGYPRPGLNSSSSDSAVSAPSLIVSPSSSSAARSSLVYLRATRTTATQQYQQSNGSLTISFGSEA